MDETNGWRVLGIAVQGASHARQGSPCQDAIEYRVLPGGVLLAALADGAGSASLSELGAQIAVEVALLSMETSLENGLSLESAAREAVLREAFLTARLALEQLALEQGEALRSYAATLTCILASGDGVSVAQLGDGAVIAGEDSNSLAAVTQPQRGEYINETYFLTQDGALDQVAMFTLDQPPTLLAAMSDGLTRLALKMPGNTPHGPFFQPLFDFLNRTSGASEAVEQLAEFLSSERVCARTDDDKTLFLAACTKEMASGQKVDMESDAFAADAGNQNAARVAQVEL